MNPEFRRNLWLELTPLRVGLIAVGVAVLLGAAYVIGGATNWFAITGLGEPGQDSARTQWSFMRATAETVILLALVLWGTRGAADAVLGEIGDRTWDGQLLSTIRPWSMVWGKLFGATAGAWLTALLAASGYAAASMALDVPYLAPLADLLLAGLAAQTTALLVSLYLIRPHTGRTRFGVVLAQSAGIIVGFFVSTTGGELLGEAVIWYGWAIPPSTFRLLALTALVFWLLVGAYRAMRLQLQLRNAPLVWLGFLGFLIVVGWGFERPLPLVMVDLFAPGGVFGSALAAFHAMVAATYLAALADPGGILRWRRWRRAMAERRWGAAAALLPAFVWSAALAIILALVARAYGPAQPILVPFVMVEAMLRDYAPAFALLMIRDLLIITFFTLDPARRGGLLAALVVLGVLYLGAPPLLAAAGLSAALPAFAPWPVGPPLLTLGGPALQAALAALLIALRVRALSGRLVPAGRPAAVAAAGGDRV